MVLVEESEVCHENAQAPRLPCQECDSLRNRPSRPLEGVACVFEI